MSDQTKRLRQMGERTLSGAEKLGFFLPYRYAANVVAPGPYPAIDALFAKAEPDFQKTRDAIEARGEALSGFKGPPPLPRWDQDWFPRADGAAAYALVAARQPRRIIEVGSGHSTRFLAAGAASYGGASLTCIDPAPRADITALGLTWHAEVLSEAHIPLFAALQPGDVAFFDSSHLLVPGSDVDIILNRILPVLASGVLVHIHDILLPDPYPDAWEWRGYAEQNALGGWLLAGGLRPIWSSPYVIRRMGGAETGVLSRLPLKPGAIETSLWAEKT